MCIFQQLKGQGRGENIISDIFQHCKQKNLMQRIERIRKERKGKKARLNKEMQGDKQMRIKVSGTEEREHETQGNRVGGKDNRKIW